MKTCAAYGCKNASGAIFDNGQKIAFHKFPLQKPSLLKQWIIAVRRKDWWPTKYSSLCGEHFTDSDYKTDRKIYLKGYAVPSVFSFSPQNQKTVKKQRIIVQNPVVDKKRKLNDDKCVVNVLTDTTSETYLCAEPSTESTNNIKATEINVMHSWAESSTQSASNIESTGVSVTNNFAIKETQTLNFTDSDYKTDGKIYLKDYSDHDQKKTVEQKIMVQNPILDKKRKLNDKHIIVNVLTDTTNETYLNPIVDKKRKSSEDKHIIVNVLTGPTNETHSCAEQSTESTNNMKPHKKLILHIHVLSHPRNHLAI